MAGLRVELMVQGVSVLKMSGERSDCLSPVDQAVSPWRGETARLLVGEETGRGGRLWVDQVELHD